MVTSGSRRQSSRPAMVGGLAASASIWVSRRNTCGIECAWMAIRLTARSLASEPSRSTTRPVGRPKRGARPVSTATRSPSCASPVAPAGMTELLAEHLLVDRLQPAAAVRIFAENSQHALLGTVDDLDDAAAVADAVVFFGFLDMQQHAVADAGGLAGARLAHDGNADFRRRAVRLLVPFVGRGDEIAVAVARGDVGQHGGGQGAGVMQLLAPFSTAPSSPSSRSMRLSSARMAFLRPKARAISRVPTLPGCLPMKARMSALEGREGVRLGGLFKIGCPAPKRRRT